MPRDGIDLRLAKRAATEGYLAGAPGREALLAQPDELEEATFDSLFPALVRMLRMRVEGGATGW